MRLESALNAGRDGIITGGQAISVIGDNIANSNTTGFKASRSEFGDMLSEGADGLQSKNIQYGGTGVELDRVRPMLAQGGVIEPTGRSLDMAIDGNGFFVTGTGGDQQYTRAGNFDLDLNGNLVTSSGAKVQGYKVGSTSLSDLNLFELGTTGTATTAATLEGNIDASSAVSTKPSAPATFNDVAAAASFTTSATVYDSLGARREITLAFFKTGDNTYNATAYADGKDTNGTKGQPVELGSSTLSFTENGLTTGPSILTAKAAWNNGAAAGNFTVDFSKFTQFASASGLRGNSQNGTGIGNVKDYEVDSNGGVFADLDSGGRTQIGTVAVATFRNIDGLSRSGTSEYRANPEAGAATIGTPGTGALGKIQGSSLERSTVDISDEFVNLILYQRGYQANSQSLNAANDLLKATIQLMS